MGLRPILGYEGLYSINEHGQVWSEPRCVPRGSNRFTVRGRWLATLVGTHGYQTVMLSKNGVCDRRLVHRMLATAWLPNDDHSAIEVNHKNGVKTDNRLTNLEWVTSGENTRHAYQAGLHLAARKLSDAQVDQVRAGLAAGESQRSIGARFGVTQSIISRIHLGQSYTRSTAEIANIRKGAHP